MGADHGGNRGTEEKLTQGIPNHPIEFRRHLAKLAC
ncbi:hypothetical protein CBM2609_A130017 [Cupriavidus taiwanensis]|nr:hypothetical protein CBM2604_A110017 [Cupriavidus taiwanensis]SOZ24607.1 hypothetical protein CBM2609_A130017 [Cupriavidus taiwanensis]SOZ44509.1 hypothetical protein CBM2610_A140017 [Cupriavidus taiwanensis]